MYTQTFEWKESKPLNAIGKHSTAFLNLCYQVRLGYEKKVSLLGYDNIECEHF